jgi:hypothetical protein
MSVISTLEAVPNRLHIVWTVLREAGNRGIERDVLQHLIVPESLTAGDEDETGERRLNAYKNALGELVHSGFAAYNGKLVVPTDTASGDFLECVERHLLAPNVNISEDRGQLAGGIAWFLTREPTKPLVWDSAPQGPLRDDFGENPETFDITNKERWQNFAYWARFLGYATFAEIGAQAVLVPDPKLALRRHLDAVLPSGQETPIGAFLNGLATITPVLEGGAARQLIEDRLVNNRRRPQRALSSATSLALRRLQIAGELRPLRRDDAEVWVVEGLHDGRISHLERR